MNLLRIDPYNYTVLQHQNHKLCHAQHTISATMAYFQNAFYIHGIHIRNPDIAFFILVTKYGATLMTQNSNTLRN